MIYFWKILLGFISLFIALYLYKYLRKNGLNTYADVSLGAGCLGFFMISFGLIFTTLRDLFMKLFT